MSITAFLTVKKDTLQRTAYNTKEKEEEELKLTSSTLTRKKIHYIREAKRKAAG
jgi:hypothetical protein